MKFSSDRLAQLLEGELGADAVTGEAALLAAHNVDGREPELLCFPARPEKVAAALRLCSEANATVTPWSGGTAMRIGNPPRAVDVVIGLERLNLLVEHDQANLTATIQSGHGLAALQEVLARHNQFLAFDPPIAPRATVGGVVATNLNGPRRGYYGSARDLVIGMKVVLASGEQIKAGGKVVKNVAGYDMCKLFVGSLGTLGIVTEVTLRMTPIPETAATVIAPGTLPQVLQLTSEISRLKLLPSAVFLLSPGARKAEDMEQSHWRLAVWCEGFEKSVARHLHDVADTATRIGLGIEILQESDHRGFWEEACDFPLQAGRLVYRVNVPRAAAPSVVQAIHAWSTIDFRPRIVSDTAMGIIWLSLDAEQGAIKWFAKLVAEAREHRGHAVMLAAPPNLKTDVDVWGSLPPTLSLMREIKRQFDPKNLLNPGRFVGGI
ncbi:MAG TPA: FAD-binding oxidoreductase [Candidatus Binatia bacterium]|nr:FAD-binding oxidoreductase [Candidatus Binatia bacterium]